jgi:hypothetical protein
MIIALKRSVSFIKVCRLNLYEAEAALSCATFHISKTFLHIIITNSSFNLNATQFYL